MLAREDTQEDEQAALKRANVTVSITDTMCHWHDIPRWRHTNLPNRQMTFFGPSHSMGRAAFQKAPGAATNSERNGGITGTEFIYVSESWQRVNPDKPQRTTRDIDAQSWISATFLVIISFCKLWSIDIFPAYLTISSCRTHSIRERSTISQIGRQNAHLQRPCSRHHDSPTASARQRLLYWTDCIQERTLAYLH
jgi:hypothetical protein